MDKIINWFILIIIFVFDPLAISLVIAANFAFNRIKNPIPEQKLAIYNEKPIKEEPKVEEPKIEEIKVDSNYSFSPPPPPTKTQPAQKQFTFIPPIFKRKRDDEDEIKIY